MDQKKKTACEIIHKVIDLSIQLAASLAAGAASSISNVFTANNSLLKMFASVNMLSGKGLSAMSSTVVNGVVIRTGYKLLDQAQFNWVGTIETQFLTSGADLFTKYLHHTGTISESNNATKTHDVHIDSGVGSDPICSRFEGDTQDLNEFNDHNLKQIMADWFDLHLTKEKRTFSKMHKGWVPEPGMPSMRAIYFGERQWPPLYGPHSKNNSLAHSVKFEQAVKVRLLKYCLGHVMSEDDTYLACMHVDDAQKQCSMDPTKQPKPWLTKYRKTMICPKPEDPKLLCQAARWYHTTDYNSHIISVPGIDQIEGWKVGDSQFSVKALLHEAYSGYEMDKNNSVEIDWRSEDLNVPAFHLPVCVNDQLHLHDMNKIPSASESHLQFPFRCGDWRANESAGFMKAMNLGPGSKIYEGIEGPPGLQHPNALFWNRIPKVCTL